jgi:hypothetical protein
MRKLNLLPSGGRGPHAPDIEVKHAALIVLACAASRNASDAGPAASRVAALVPWQGKPFELMSTLGDAVAAALADPNTAAKIARIEIFHPQDGDWANYRDARATIFWREGESENRTDYLSREGIEKLRPLRDVKLSALGNAFLLDACVIGGAFLCEIASLLTGRPRESDWK